MDWWSYFMRLLNKQSLTEGVKKKMLPKTIHYSFVQKITWHNIPNNCNFIIFQKFVRFSYVYLFPSIWNRFWLFFVNFLICHLLRFHGEVVRVIAGKQSPLKSLNTVILISVRLSRPHPATSPILCQLR